MKDEICLIEDDPSIGELVSKKLLQIGYRTSLFMDAESAIEASEEKLSDLYIVDILLRGKMTGLHVCRRLRQMSGTIPILILSALADASDRIEGLRLGADDYLTKPFEMDELLLRVDGMLRRRSWYRELPKNQSIYSWDGNSVNFLTYESNAGAGPFYISQKECMIMKILIEHEGEVVNREEILERVWGYNVYPSTRTVDNFILRLRKYFEDSPGNPRYIHSVRGLGYRFTSEPKE